jgi:hypothetical protein
MELIHHIANATFSRESSKTISLENLASTKRISGLLKNGTVSCAARSRDDSKGKVIAPSRRSHGSSKVAGKLVEPTGIEPVTSCLQSRRSPS